MEIEVVFYCYFISFAFQLGYTLKIDGQFLHGEMKIPEGQKVCNTGITYITLSSVTRI